MSKLWEKDYSHLDPKIDFPQVDYSRSVQAKIKGRWVTIFNMIINRHTIEGYRGTHMNTWPGYAEACANFPEATKFRITMTMNILPWHFMR